MLHIRFSHTLLIWLGVLLLGSLLAAPVYAAEESTAANNTARIAGIVTNADGVPLAGIQVRIYDHDPLNPAQPWSESALNRLHIITDNAGAYLFPDLPGSAYTLFFVDPSDHYAFTFYGNTTTLANALLIPVTPGETTTGINISLQPGGQIAGYASLYDGTPVAQSLTSNRVEIPGTSGETMPTHGNLQISFYDGSEWRFLYQIGFHNHEKRFDPATSRFRIGGLAPGQYQIRYTAWHKGICRPYCNEFTGYVSLDGTAPATITLQPGQIKDDLTVVIGAERGYGRMQGKVVNANGTPLAGMEVQTYQQTSTPLAGEKSWVMLPSRSSVTDEAGNYEIPTLSPGAYTLRFYDPKRDYAYTFYKDATLLPNAVGIGVTADTLTSNENVTLQVGGGRIRGYLRLFDGTPASQANSHLVDLQGKPHRGSVWVAYYNGYQWEELDRFSLNADSDYFTVATSTYSFGGLAAGVYRLGFTVHHNRADINYLADDDIVVNLGETTQKDAVIGQPAANNPDHGQISGVVTTNNNTPLAGIALSLYHYNPELGMDRGWSRSAPRITTDSQGRYQLSLPPGQYKLFFIDPNGNYAYKFYGDGLRLGDSPTITVQSGVHSSGLNATLLPAAQITGHISLLDGTPLAAVEGLAGLGRQGLLRGEITAHFYDGETWQELYTATIFDQAEGYIDRTAFWLKSTAISYDLASNLYRLRGLASDSIRLSFGAWHQQVRYGEFYHDADTIEIATDIPVRTGETTPNIDAILGTDNQRTLALYALALDNDPDAINNLAPQLTPAMQSIIDATRDQPNKTAVVLADAAGSSDTRIYVVRNGRATPVRGLPNANFQLDPTLTEFNMADGVTLGNFIRWARTTYPAQVTIFGFAGHGEALAPKTDLQKILQPGSGGGGVQPLVYGGLFPLPRRIWTSPTYTDNHPTLALITPYDLAEALRIGSQNGTNPLQIADIAHCFAASIEELYELSPGSQPYAEIIIAAPNYAYLDPPALGQALAAINTTLTPARMASTILQTYDRLVAQVDANDGDADVEHPRLLVAVNSRQVVRIKQGWDQVAATLLQNLDVSKIRNAYLASPKYDSPLCDAQTWALATPDALVDLASFAQALQAQYSADSAVGQAITPVLADLKTVLIDRFARNGVPWFAPPDTPPWNFDQHQGIALFADLHGRPLAEPSRVELRWQTRWYTADPLGGDNPHPFAFVQSRASAATWATVLAEYWRQQGVAIETSVCFPDPLVNSQSGELRSDRLIYPISGTLAVGAPLHLAAAVQSEHALVKPEVRFALYDANQTLLFSETVRGGYWLTGTHPMAATRRYTPTAPGPLTVVVQVDPNQRVTEKNESDNQLTAYFVVAGADFTPLTIQAALPDEALLISADRLALPVTVTPAGGAAQLVAQIQQYTVNEGTQVWTPHLVAVQELDPARPELRLAGLQPGPVVVHLWARSPADRYSTSAATLRFNYAPAGLALGAGQTHYYLAPTGRSAALTFHLACAKGSEAHLLAWSPFNAWSADWTAQISDLTLTLPPLVEPGDYLVAVQSHSGGPYTLSTVSNVTAASSTPVAPLASTAGITSRPTFLTPIPPAPTAVIHRVYLGQVWR